LPAIRSANTPLLLLPVAWTLRQPRSLLRIRGDAMQNAVPVGQGAMAALLGLDFEAAEEIASEAAQGEVCQAANDNAPGQVVVSGHLAAVERAVEIAKARGARRAVMSAGQRAVPLFADGAGRRCDGRSPANADLKGPKCRWSPMCWQQPITDPNDIRKRLVEQVTGTVRWRESISWLAGEGVDTFVEVGTGKVLTGMVKRIAKEASGHCGQLAGRHRRPD
jgi:[acyl-carrier-protein] S-malonyltransferase